MKESNDRVIERYEAYSTFGIDHVLKDISENRLAAGRYADLVKIKNGDKPRKEIFNGYSKND